MGQAPLWGWDEQHGDGIVFTASGGFHLPNGAVRAADAACVRARDWDALSTEQQEEFGMDAVLSGDPVLPGFTIDLKTLP